ncbi:DUF4882 family protein [Acinetobacter colistiniresistens]|uniref:DUF4882 domain-containing protein n=1 Tax=Acinetobacter colistiniresistens TaxID=280145 RepID=S3T8J1_9GAMM|nr:DUF4882 family protein [Acinetobacter colistiniresistens]EPG37856.1 hypothetical protein F907_01826 [Acinetobacter colistiniresistens]TVT83663.1 DUF4882 domain-containing protein [Acinetobacter colistiniresistens]
MKKLSTVILGSLLSIGSASGACRYDLDATAAQISAMPTTIPNLKFPTVTGQRSAFQVTSNKLDTYNVKMFFAASANTAQQMAINNQILVGDKNIAPSGQIAFEFLINNFSDTLVTSNTFIAIGYNIILTDTANALKLANIYVINDSVSGSYIKVNFSDMNGGNDTTNIYPIAISSIPGLRIGMFINQNTKQIGLNINGINKGYITSFNGIPSKLSFLTSGYTMYVKNNDPNIGQTISGELVTDKNKMGLTYAPSTTDICGTTL